ncbi:hypothetical protein DKX38_005878 [Salix brachista]|uniref:Uncharacterized protein n=1 Tax=Salix brachista TaxID=2182728 RepID=A0A5N5N382_9ROSI|nr:hypothetical protein DKX38_005878 [Salix brachista]
MCAVCLRPSIDMHKGKVKKIVGSTLRDLKGEDGSALVTNFESDETAAEFANLHKEDGLMGGADDLSKSIAIEELFVGLRFLSLVDWICSPLFEMLPFAISVPMACVISSLFKDKPLHRTKMILFGLFYCLLMFVLAEKKELCFAEDIPDLLAQLGKFANKVLFWGLQVGGGINVNDALSYEEEGASHVIVTSVC